jgi:HlyD family type I secretion membrane fusion protein
MLNRIIRLVSPPPLPADARPADVIASRARTRFVWTSAAGLLAFILWAGVTSLDKVTRGTGRIIPQTSNRIVQHLEGGIVSEILVREGQVVAEGTALVRIDNSFSRAELQQNSVEAKARRLTIQRLEAESRGARVFFADSAIRAELPEIAAREMDLFRARTEGLDAQLRVTDDQLRQKELEISELRTKFQNIGRERELVLPRVTSLRRLSKQGAVSMNELLDSERTLQQIDSRLAEMRIEIPRAEASLSEIGRRREEIIARFRAEAEKERREAGVQLARIEESVNAMQDRDRRFEVTAPIAGVVNRLHVNTIGGVVKSGEPIAQIVPVEDTMIVEARLSPQDRAEVFPGLPAVVKITAYDYSIHGGLKGRVLDISPDALSDEKGEVYFRVRLAANAAGFGPGRPVVPGMMAQVDILTGRHTVLDYLLKPARMMQANALRQ